MAPQFNVQIEWPFQKHKLWSTVAGIGLGRRVSTLAFKSASSFTPNHQSLEFENDLSDLGYYAEGKLGLSRRHAVGGLLTAHTLAATVVLPLQKENSYLGVPSEKTNELPPYHNPILEGRVDIPMGAHRFYLDWNTIRN